MANEDKATRYHRLRRRTSLLASAAGALLWVGLLVTGASAALRDLAAALSGNRLYPTILIDVLLLAALTELVQLPLAFYEGVTLERRYGLSIQTTLRWWSDRLKAWAVAVVFALLAACLVFTLIRWNPTWWWLMATVCFTGVLIIMAQLAPILLLPLFYTVKPLDRESLVARLVALAARAQTRVLGVFEWELSSRTKKANAALLGMGRTRRILLSDTLLAAHSEDEIEVILAHELGHHVHHDMWSAMAVEAGLIGVGLYLSDRVLDLSAGSFGLMGKADVAVLPLLLLTVGAASIALMPVFNAFSRAHERRADRYALQLTNNAPAFVTAMRRLAAQNLAEEQPSRIVESLFHTHPSIASRIAAARMWVADQRELADP